MNQYFDPKDNQTDDIDSDEIGPIQDQNYGQIVTSESTDDYEDDC